MATGVADEEPAIDAVYRSIRQWFPRSKVEDCEELAFAIVHDVLHLKPVDGELWVASLDASPAD